MMIDAKMKAKWLKALRSGEYKQGRELLKTKDGKYCCLGVLAEINGHLKENGCVLLEYVVEHRPSQIYTAGILDTDGGSWRNDVQGTVLEQAMEMNDSFEHDFNSIADYIEENLVVE